MAEIWRDSESLAEEFSVPVATVRAWRSKGVGPRGVRIGRHVRYAQAEVDRWLAQLSAAEGPRTGDAAC